jgi:ABC-type multidrug transport system permease subunit
MYTLLAMVGIAGLVVLPLLWGIRRLKAVPATEQRPGKRILIYLAGAAAGAVIFGVVGFALVFFLGPVVYPEDPLFGAIVGVSFGTPVAAVIGAMVGALIARKRLARRQTGEHRSGTHPSGDG